MNGLRIICAVYSLIRVGLVELALFAGIGVHLQVCLVIFVLCFLIAYDGGIYCVLLSVIATKSRCVNTSHGICWSNHIALHLVFVQTSS